MEGWGRKWIRNEERSLCRCASMIQHPFPPGLLFLAEWGDPLNVRCMAVWAQSRAVPSSWEDNWRWARRRIPGEPEELDRRLRSEWVQLTWGLGGFLLEEFFNSSEIFFLGHCDVSHLPKANPLTHNQGGEWCREVWLPKEKMLYAQFLSRAAPRS